MESPWESPRYPEPAEVFDAIGEKVTTALVKSVQGARADLREYRECHPRWVASSSARGLANWIHDRLWDHLVVQIDAVPGVETIERGVTREMVVGIHYRFRIKRHSEDGNVESYATPTFLDFVMQPNAQLPGMEEKRLIAGYIWDDDVREIGDTVISMRDGRDNVIWRETLPEVADGGTATVAVTPPKPKPSTPTVAIPPEIGKRQKGETGSE